ncbi:hypothetical protein [Haliscomenobacter hydrossis]|uniref:Uncharacterized protein n=1 Tax=Haliscomenobacter hydrossis (strain ATCC 27775 / DSM 1100 / LMG 10767 / O) TaxID=760192 RepID=F4L316_HALH1|nr:hypothetical protein [Haliscomenobacter hydrossis]AEE50675.1 hypothetical protein Halhy_2809 [Haliscomenobacter hydrossis DSM 1100]
MDLQQARILVRKINSLFKSMEMDGSPQPTPIERDLMLSYLRQLYQAFLTDATDAHKVTVTAPVVEIPVSTPPPKSEPSTPIVETPKPYVPPVVTIVEPPKVEVPPVIEQREEPKVYIPPVEIPVPVVPEVKPTPEPPKPEPSPQPTGTNAHGLESLFSFKKATELSEKLSEMPIADLTKGMSINDRLLYMNELFGRDMSKLDEVLRALNNFPSLESAKSYLMGIAGQYNWSQEERSEIAQSFIKLVRRRFV